MNVFNPVWSSLNSAESDEDSEADLSANCPGEPEQAVRPKLDQTDIYLLRELQRADSPTRSEISNNIGLSPSNCSRRLTRLKARGVIRGSVMLLNAKALGLCFQASVDVALSEQVENAAELFEKAMADCPEVTECAALLGGAEYVLRVVTRDIQAFELFLVNRLQSLGYVEHTVTSAALHISKRTTELPLGHIPVRQPSKRSKAYAKRSTNTEKE